MRALFDDVIQRSDALADRFGYSSPVTVTFDVPSYIDAVGIGFTDAALVRLTWSLVDGLVLNNMGAATPESEFEAVISDGSLHDKPNYFAYELLPDSPPFSMRNETVVIVEGNGLYEVPPVAASGVTIECGGGTYIGRFGAGKAVPLGTSLPKEPAFNTTEENRKTLSGQTLPGTGGYNFRSVGLDTRYKIGGDAMREIKAAYPGRIAKGFPFFLLFDTEARRLPFYRLYAKDKSTDKFGFESSVHDPYLFSRKFEFEECF